jgi:hypothetical protein
MRRGASLSETIHKLWNRRCVHIRLRRTVVLPIEGARWLLKIALMAAVIPMSAKAAIRTLLRPMSRRRRRFLGAVLIDNRVIEELPVALTPVHFFEPVHARIYERFSNCSIARRWSRPSRSSPISKRTKR